jgi:hypothetical protein
MRKPETQFETLLYILAFICLSGGVFMFSIFANMEMGMPDGQTLTLMCLGPAAIAWLFYRRLGGRGWLVTSLVGGGMALFIFTAYLAAEDVIHPALLLAMYAFTAAGVALYAVNRRRSAEKHETKAPVEWEKLGSRKDNPADRDVPRAA